jgi:hypothetical protein
MKKIMMFCLGSLFAIAQVQAVYASKKMSGDEIKALLTNKTVSVALVGKNIKWRQYFGPDGKSNRDNGETSEWSVEGDKHCNTAAMLKCAAVVDNGDGTYSRMKPNGEATVKWTNIVEGKQF